MICSTTWMKVSRGCVRRVSGALFIALTATAPATADPLKVFAAASLTDALDQALTVCNDTPATGIYAGSGTIARQIEQGAPADLYISANPQWMDWLQKRGMIVADTRVDLLGNDLVLIVNTERAESDPEGMNNAPFAIADPITVPVGRYAKQALEQSKMWPPHPTRTIYAGNAREVLAWVARGNARSGVVYMSDATGEPRVSIVKPFAAETHDPIRYPAAVIADNDSPNARRLLACLQGEEASDVFEQFGFTVLTR